MALPGLTAEVAFGAAREAIRNAARHGRAGDAARPLHLVVETVWREGLRLVVEDDGVGIAAGPPAGSGGQGIALHGTLLALVGGTLAVEDAPGGGTRVTISLPYRRGHP
jgi:signal transduction histidine kinase